MKILLICITVVISLLALALLAAVIACCVLSSRISREEENKFKQDLK